MKSILRSGRCRAMVLPVLLIFAHSCRVVTKTDLAVHSVIPAPRSVSATYGAFPLIEPVLVVADTSLEEVHSIAGYLAGELELITGMEVKLVQSGRSGRIYLELGTDTAVYPQEGYGLFIDRKVVRIEAADPAGLFRGVQTLGQVLEFNNQSIYEPEGEWFIPTGVITDHPEYRYRGTMLDVSRHFFSVEDVKRYIDLIALYKLNVLHLHLSDDQGWRIEIKSWPRLTEVGGSTQVGGGEGGFYTQEEYREIVAYAAERYITVVPEIDMPGHTNAALASYAALNADGKARELYTGTRVGFSSLSTGKEITYQFVEDVIGELAALTEGPYLHIGGDESHSTDPDDYISFVERIQNIVGDNGKIMIGWDEISHAGLDRSSVAQYWASAENANRAVKQGCRVIMSPAGRCYLDMKYDSTTRLGLHWAGFIELDKAYQWDPDTLVEGITKEDILGIESPLWSETVSTIDDIEYLAFPRLIAHAEIGWSDDKDRNWEQFSQRLVHHGILLDKRSVNYHRSPLVDWEKKR